MIKNFIEAIKASTTIKTVISLMAFCYTLLIYGLILLADKVEPNSKAIEILISAYSFGFIVISVGIYKYISNFKNSNINKDKESETKVTNKNFKLLENNYKNGVTQNCEYFNKVINSDINKWATRSTTWPVGVYESRIDYNQILIDAYKASESVKATTTKKYLSNWDSDLGSKLINAHEVSKKQVERLFIFSDLKSIDKKSKDVLALMLKHGFITSRIVFMDELIKLSATHASLERDFAIIEFDDGLTVAETIEFATNNLTANWYFGENNMKIKGFEKDYSILRRHSHDLHEKMKEI